MTPAEETDVPQISGAGDPARVDVGIPSYRRSDYLAAAIASVVGQTFRNWRLTVSDNGVGGGAIWRAVEPFLSDSRIRYVATNEECPLAQNWTNAVHGSADYLAILNDDDTWHPDFLGRRVLALDEHPECGLALSGWLLVDEQGRQIGESPLEFEEGVVSQPVLARAFRRHNPTSPSSVFLRRSAYEAVGGAFDESWRYSDWEMWARVAAQFPAYFLPVRDSDWRRHENAYTFTDTEAPDLLLAMVDHINALFSHVDGSRSPRRLGRARNRSSILLRAASDVHTAGGWRASGTLHRRAIREFPPSAFDYLSIRMTARSLLGERGFEWARRWTRPLRGLDIFHRFDGSSAR